MKKGSLTETNQAYPCKTRASFPCCRLAALLFCLLVMINGSLQASAHRYNQYCSFKADYVSKHRVSISSLSQGESVIAQLGDLPNKHKWDDSVIKNKSHLISNNTEGLVYHFEQHNTETSLFQSKIRSTDYFREIYTKNHFKGCVIKSNTPIKYSTVEYKLFKEAEHFYIERTLRVVFAGAKPPFAQKMLDKSNAKSLEESIKKIKSRLLKN